MQLRARPEVRLRIHFPIVVALKLDRFTGSSLLSVCILRPQSIEPMLILASRAGSIPSCHLRSVGKIPSSPATSTLARSGSERRPLVRRHSLTNPIPQQEKAPAPYCDRRHLRRPGQLPNALPFLVNFSAPWCQTCKDISENLRDLIPELGNHVRFVGINIEANRGITVLNAPGTIDDDYGGEIKITLRNS